MPRPKRTKVAPSAPGPRVRQAAKFTTVKANVRAPENVFNELYDVSDPDEGAATSVRRVKRDNGKGQAVATLKTNSRVKSPRGVEDDESMGQKAVEEAGTDRNSPAIPGEKTLLEDIDLDSSSPGIEVGRRERGIATTDDSVLSIGTRKRRSGRPRSPGRASARARSSSVESNLADDSGLTGVGTKNHFTPAIGNFRRRRREPSILGRNAMPMRSSSIGLEMDKGTPAVGSSLKLGNFKRRAREPSLLGTAQKAQPRRPEYDDDNEDFNPEDESTPLNLTKTRVLSTSSAASGSNSRKRKLSSRHVPESSPTLPSTGELGEQEVIPATAPSSDIPTVDNEAYAPPEELPIPSIEARSVTPEPVSETMAPPQSSSASPESLAPSRHAQSTQIQRAPSRGRKRQQRTPPLLLNQDSPPSSPPSLTHSPDGPPHQTAPKRRARRQPPPPSTLSTAQLQALLPRRRRRGTRDPFDIASSEDEIDVSGLASDDDELTHFSVRAPPRRGVLNRIPAPPKKPNRAGAAVKSKPGRKATYSRVNATSDKENEEHDPDDSLAPLPDDEEGAENSQELEKRVGKELKMAAKKFKEVDEWKLDFEDNTASSSSPNDAR